MWFFIIVYQIWFLPSLFCQNSLDCVVHLDQIYRILEHVELIVEEWCILLLKSLTFRYCSLASSFLCRSPFVFYLFTFPSFFKTLHTDKMCQNMINPTVMNRGIEIFYKLSFSLRKLFYVYIFLFFFLALI